MLIALIPGFNSGKSAESPLALAHPAAAAGVLVLGLVGKRPGLAREFQSTPAVSRLASCNRIPALQALHAAGRRKDGAMFFVRRDIAVLTRCVRGGCLYFATSRKREPRPKLERKSHRLVPALIFFFRVFALLTIAYLTHQQPIIFPRYGLISSV
jgi:hypothetical protein